MPLQILGLWLVVGKCVRFVGDDYYKEIDFPSYSDLHSIEKYNERNWRTKNGFV